MLLYVVVMWVSSLLLSLRGTETILGFKGHYRIKFHITYFDKCIWEPSKPLKSINYFLLNRVYSNDNVNIMRYRTKRRWTNGNTYCISNKALQQKRFHWTKIGDQWGGLTGNHWRLFKKKYWFDFDEIEIVNNRAMNIWLYAKCRTYIDPDNPEKGEALFDAEVEITGNYDGNPTW